MNNILLYFQIYLTYRYIQRTVFYQHCSIEYGVVVHLLMIRSHICNLLCYVSSVHTQPKRKIFLENTMHPARCKQHTCTYTLAYVICGAYFQLKLKREYRMAYSPVTMYLQISDNGNFYKECV